jgi:hypothetical protein
VCQDFPGNGLKHSCYKDCLLLQYYFLHFWLFTKPLRWPSGTENVICINMWFINCKLLEDKSSVWVMYSITASQNRSITVSQYHSITASQLHSISITASHNHTITVSQYCWTRCCSWVVSTPASYSGALGIQKSSQRLAFQTEVFCGFFVSPFRQVQG